MIYKRRQINKYKQKDSDYKPCNYLLTQIKHDFVTGEVNESLVFHNIEARDVKDFVDDSNTHVDGAKGLVWLDYGMPIIHVDLGTVIKFLVTVRFEEVELHHYNNNIKIKELLNKQLYYSKIK